MYTCSLLLIRNIFLGVLFRCFSSEIGFIMMLFLHHILYRLSSDIMSLGDYKCHSTIHSHEKDGLALTDATTNANRLLMFLCLSTSLLLKLH